jgi:integrase
MSHVEDRHKRPGRHAGKRWRARYTDPDGRERSKSFDRKTDADRFLIQVEADVLHGTYLDPDAGKVTLRRYAEGWAKGWHADSASAGKIRSHLDSHILPGLGGRTLAQLAARPSAVQQWLAGLPLSARTAGQVLGTLSAICSAAADDGLITRNPCRADSVRVPRVPQRKVVPWTAAEVAAVRAALPEPYRALADCGAGLGLRQGEILALGPDETDFLRRKVHVRRQLKVAAGRAWFALPKGGRERDVPLPGPVALALSAHLAAHRTAEVTLPWHEPGSRRHGQPVTCTLAFTAPAPGGAVRYLTASLFNKAAWRPARAAAGVAHGDRGDGMHALRHYYASALLAGGVDVRALSEYLGHHDPGFTLRVYAHLMPSAEGRALRAIEAAFSAASGPQTAQEGVKAP